MVGLKVGTCYALHVIDNLIAYPNDLRNSSTKSHQSISTASAYARSSSFTIRRNWRLQPIMQVARAHGNPYHTHTTAHLRSVRHSIASVAITYQVRKCGYGLSGRHF